VELDGDGVLAVAEQAGIDEMIEEGAFVRAADGVAGGGEIAGVALGYVVADRELAVDPDDHAVVAEDLADKAGHRLGVGHGELQPEVGGDGLGVGVVAETEGRDLVAVAVAELGLV